MNLRKSSIYAETFLLANVADSRIIIRGAYGGLRKGYKFMKTTYLKIGTVYFVFSILLMLGSYFWQFYTYNNFLYGPLFFVGLICLVIGIVYHVLAFKQKSK